MRSSNLWSWLGASTGFIWSHDAGCVETTPCVKRSQPDVGSGNPLLGILRALVYENAKLDPHDRVTIDSIRDHTSRHFPVQQVARATYREILERRAQDNDIDFVKSVATAITPMAFLETVMVKGYETLVDPDTKG